MLLDADSGEQLAHLFETQFEIRTADTPDLLDAIWALRYQVYCVENQFLPAAAYDNERERDEFDEHSLHAVLIHRATGEVVGCVRLVLSHAAGRPRPIPLHRLLGAEARARLDSFDQMRLAEISRYAVSKRFRRRAGEQLYPDVGMEQVGGPDPRRLMPHISLGLFRAVGRLALENDVSTMCAAMAPSLLRLLERFDISFEHLGPAIDYHGLRQPCLAHLNVLLAELEREHGALFHFITHD
jgi:N-acyl amino acid synthase of PEP-CTERM/exosortase system